MHKKNGSGSPPFLVGGGEMGALIRAHDWSAHPIGPPEQWPHPLRMAIRLMLNTGHPMYVWWGSQLYCFYNDAYRASIGPERHPASLGRPGREVWSEIWDIIAPQIEQVMSGGEPTWHVNALVPITRHGNREDVYWTYSYGPIDDESAPNRVGGVLVLCTETTEIVRAERRRKVEAEQQRLLFEQAPGFIIIMRGADHRVEFVNVEHRKLFNSGYWVGKTIRDAFQSIEGQGFFEALDEVYRSGRTLEYRKQEVRYQRSPDTSEETRYLNFIYAPIRDEHGAISGIFCEGFDATESHIMAKHAEALADLGAHIRETEDPDELAFAAVQILGQTLNVSRAGYGTINVRDETISIDRDWNMPGVRSLAGLLHFRDYGSYIEDLKAGRTVVIADADRDPRTAEGARALKAISAQSLVNMPVTEQGGFVALLYLNNATARTWTDAELVLIREVAERTRTAVERRRAESALRAEQTELRETAERYRLAAKATNDAIWDWRLSDDHVLWNAALQTLFGHPHRESTAQWWLSTIHPEDRARVEENIHAAIDDGGTLWSDEYRFLRLDGSYAHVMDRGAVLRNESGKPVRMIGAMLDLTERRYAEERLQAATRAAQLGTWDFNPVSGELRWDARCKALFGLPPEAPVSYETFLGGLHPDDRARTDHAVQAALAPEGPSSYDIEYRTVGLTDGVERWCAATGNAIFANGRAIRFVGTIRDISERKRAEERLMIVNRTGAQIAAELDVDNIVQMITDAGVALTSAEFGAFFYNVVDKRGERYMLYALSGVPREEFSKFPMPRNTAVFAPTFAGQGVVRSDDILEDPRYGHSSPHYGMPAGHLPVRSYLAVPVVSRSGEVQGGLFFGHGQQARFTKEHEALLLGLAGQAATAIDNSKLYQALQRANDTLEQRVADEIAERSKVEEALRQAQKMEAIGQLTGGIAHDFNNLLGAIGGSFSLIERRIADGRPGADRYISAGQDAVRRAASLTQRLLAFSRRATLDSKPTDVNKLIVGMEDLVRRTVGPDIDVEVVGQAGLWLTKIDASQLESALLNLCINGRDAMAPHGGRLTIETANKWLDDRAARERDLAPGQFISLCVSDTGTGMDQDTMARAFDPFFTTKPIGHGTGLGLSMVYGFTRQSGGQVRIYSELGKGTTVCLYLPRYSGGLEDRIDSEPAATIEPGAGATVLLIDDEATLRMLVADVLEEAGYRVLLASTGPEGLKTLQSDARIDLLVTDVGLPGGMNGRQVADAARITRPDLKVLFITGYAENAAIGSGHLERGMIVVTKPFVITEFAAKVRDLIDS